MSCDYATFFCVPLSHSLASHPSSLPSIGLGLLPRQYKHLRIAVCTSLSLQPIRPFARRCSALGIPTPSPSPSPSSVPSQTGTDCQDPLLRVAYLSPFVFHVSSPLSLRLSLLLALPLRRLPCPSSCPSSPSMCFRRCRATAADELKIHLWRMTPVTLSFAQLLR